MKVVQLGAREIGVLRWDDRVYAMHNYCPHNGGPVCLGPVGGLRTSGSSPYEPRIDQSIVTVSCPWHRWEFNVETGRSILGKHRVKVYPVEVRAGRVFVEVGRMEPAHEAPEASEDQETSASRD